MKKRFLTAFRHLAVAAVVLVTISIGRPVTASEAAERPPITGGVPFFYYENFEEAVDWYENQLGLRKSADKNWVVVFEITPSSYLGVVNASGGSLAPTENKGALLSIEVEELEAWHHYLSGKPGVDLIHGIEEGAYGMIEEFRMKDPGGYIVEFFRWKITPEQRLHSDIGNQAP